MLFPTPHSTVALLLVAFLATIHSGRSFTPTINRSPRSNRLTTPANSLIDAAKISTTVVGPLWAKAASAAKKRPRQNHEKWQPLFDKLVVYKEKNGHCQVPEDEEPLGPWLAEQLECYYYLQTGKKTKLTKKRGTALERLGAIPTDILERRR